MLVTTGCSILQDTIGKINKFDMTKNVGETYYVSVPCVTKHEQPDATSKAVGFLKMGDTIVVSAIVPLQGHLATDEADSWLQIADGSYIPGNTIVEKILWDEQLSGLPPKGEVKIKNFTSSKHQDTDASLDQANLSNIELLLLLGANGSMSSEDGKAYPTELGEYIKTQNQVTGDLKIRLPETEANLAPNPLAFNKIGPYQEFDMGAGLAMLMMKNAIAPTHPVTIYVKGIVDKLVKHSTLPYAYGGFNVIILKDDASINASAAPGGFVFVTTGMLKYLKSEEELALILAHEIGHLEFHHSVRELGPIQFSNFAVAALVADIDLNNPKVKDAIRKIATELFNTWLSAETQKAKMLGQEPPSAEAANAQLDKLINEQTAMIQGKIDDAKELIMELLQSLSDNMSQGHEVEFEAAADRRAVSLAAAAGYNADALLDVLSRIKADNNGFGKAYPVNRDELVRQFKASFNVTSPVTPADYNAIRVQVEKITDADLFIKK